MLKPCILQVIVGVSVSENVKLLDVFRCELTTRVDADYFHDHGLIIAQTRTNRGGVDVSTLTHRLLRSSDSGAYAAAYTMGPSTGPRPASSVHTSPLRISRKVFKESGFAAKFGRSL